MGRRLSFYFHRFTKDGVLTELANDFALVKKAFIERFCKWIKAQDIIPEATDAALDENEPIPSIYHLTAMYAQTGFNDEAKSGILRLAVTKLPLLETFAMYRFSSNYDDLK